MKYLSIVLFFLFQNAVYANSTATKSSTISVMAYNVENLFDEVNDGLRNETIITAEVLTKKIDQISKGILQVQGKGPDILILEEVENLRVLNKLNEKLKPADYQTVALLDSNDERGIDVGIMSRFPLAGKVTLHPMPFADVNPTRGILEVPLKLSNNKIIHVFAVHFPSQANPTGQRKQAAEYLRMLMNQVSRDEYAIAGGDFNIIKDEEEKNHYFAEIFKDFQVSHFIGCKQCPGTHYYKKDWSFLDALISRDGNLAADSIQTPNRASTQIHKNGSPRTFEAKTGLGISDHLPIYGELQIEN